MTIDFSTALIIINLSMVSAGIIYLLYHPREPRAMLAWLMAFVLLPVIGVSLFFLLSDPSLNRRRRRLRRYRKGLNPKLWSQLEAINQQYSPSEEFSDQSNRQSQFIHLAQSISAAQPPLCGNQITIYHDDAEDVANDMIAAIEAARHHVHLEYFTFESDASGQRIAKALIAKAEQGIACRMLLDYLGSWHMSAELDEELTQAGIEVVYFMPLRPWRGQRWGLRFNFRNHRKIAVIDGEIGFVGSQNIGDEYFGKGDQFDRWVDTHLKITGPAVYQLQETFIEDWHLACKKDLFAEEFFPDLTRNKANEIVQIIPSGPDYDARIMHHLLLAAISTADKSILIVSPYFVPDTAITLMLEAAAFRGVKVRLLMPAASDHKIALWVGRSYYSELLSAGVELYEFTQGFLHSKLVLIDQYWGMIGSANMDERSFRLNFEVTAVLYNTEAVNQLYTEVEVMLQQSRQIEQEDLPDSLFVKLKLGASRLLSPMY